MPLTDTQVRKAQPSERAKRLFDGGGMYLELAPSGGKWWRLKYRFGGKEKRLSLGTYPDTSLKTARERRDEARRLLASGTDPSQARKAEKVERKLAAENSFEAVASDWLDHREGKWSSETRQRIKRSLEADVYPRIGKTPIAAVRPQDVMDLVKAIERRGAGDVAGRVLQRIRSVFRFAVTHERIASNPMVDLQPAELLKARQVTSRAALAEADLPEFLRRLDAYDGHPSTAAALRLLMLTAVRPGELRGARWCEIDLDAEQWRIPGARMKMGEEHVVPLSRQSIALLRAMPRDDDLVFPSPYYPGKALSENTLNSALARMGYKGYATAHGFRALFSTVANECGHDADVIERQLAHVERNKVRAAYHRATYTADRVKLMQWWADYIDGKRSGTVVPIGKRVA